MSTIVKHILANLPPEFNAQTSYTLGLSGGVDSVVLLHALTTIRTLHNFKLSALHINHGISPYAESWQDFCQALCNNLDVPISIIKHQITRQGGESLENNARNARYQTFLSNISDVIVLAHQQNDQIETTLSQIFRGSDLHNIGAMHVLGKKQHKLFWRPLLNTSRSLIEEYAKEHGLNYITDESNFDNSYLRNFIRNQVLPLLTHWDQNIASKILNINKQLQDTLSIVDEIAITDLAIITIAHNDSNAIVVGQFKQLSIKRQINALSYFIKSRNLPLPSTKQIQEFNRQILNSEWDRTPQLSIDNVNKIIKHKNLVYIG